LQNAVVPGAIVLPRNSVYENKDFQDFQDFHDFQEVLKKTVKNSVYGKIA